MRKALWEPFGVPYLLALSVLVTVMAVGCGQNGDGGDTQPSDAQTAVTEAGMTAEETTAGEESTTQKKQDGGQDEATRDQGQAQQRQGAREEGSSDRQQGEQQTIMVRVTGTEGLSFAGRVGTAQDRRRAQGRVPEEFEVPFEGAAVTAVVRKQEPGGGTLGVEVVREGRVVASRETSTSTGVVNVVWTSREEPDGSGG